MKTLCAFICVIGILTIPTFAAGNNLFTSTQGKTIRVDPSVTTVLLPCAVTNQDVDVTLYKLEGDEFTTVAKSSDTDIFNPKRGFRVNLRNVENPEGRYICAGRYDGQIKDVEYVIKFETVDIQSDAPAKYQEAIRRPEEITCQTHTDCPPTMLCQSGSRYNICIDPCIVLAKCGRGSRCKLVDGAPHCFCPRGYSGNPAEQCLRDP